MLDASFDLTDMLLVNQEKNYNYKFADGLYSATYKVRASPLFIIKWQCITKSNTDWIDKFLWKDLDSSRCLSCLKGHGRLNVRMHLTSC